MREATLGPTHFHSLAACQMVKFDRLAKRKKTQAAATRSRLVAARLIVRGCVSLYASRRTRHTHIFAPEVFCCCCFGDINECPHEAGRGRAGGGRLAKTSWKKVRSESVFFCADSLAPMAKPFVGFDERGRATRTHEAAVFGRFLFMFLLFFLLPLQTPHCPVIALTRTSQKDRVCRSRAWIFFSLLFSESVSFFAEKSALGGCACGFGLRFWLLARCFRAHIRSCAANCSAAVQRHDGDANEMGLTDGSWLTTHTHTHTHTQRSGVGSKVGARSFSIGFVPSRQEERRTGSVLRLEKD